MDDFQVTLNAKECQYLLELLKGTLKDMCVEEHRTRTPKYREYVIEQETIAEGLLNKLRQEPA